MPKQIGDLILYNVEELSQLFDVQQATIRKYLREKKIEGRKLARKWYVTEYALHEYFNSSDSDKVYMDR